MLSLECFGGFISTVKKQQPTAGGASPAERGYKMESIKKIIVDELEAHGYKYNVRIFTSVDGGKKFYYCGVGRYCKSLQEIYKTEAKQ